MGLRYNPFTGSFDMTRSPGSYLDGEVATYSDLPLDTAAAPLNSAWLVRGASGLWLLSRKPAGIYIRTATGGTDRDADYTYAGTFPDVFSDANFVVYNDTDSTKNLKLDTSGLTTGTTRTLTVPDASGTLPLLETANTFTQNQTLNGTNNVAPNQTAASGSSIMTRDLVALDQISPRNIILRDDFLVAAATTPATATMGELRWQIANSGSIATSWQAGTVGSTYGVARIGTGTTTDNYTTIYVGHASNAANRSFLNDLDFVISARLAINDIANVEFRAGIFSAATNLFAGTFSAAGQYFRFDSATDTYWTGVSASTNSAGNISATTVAPSNGVFYNIVFRRSGSSLYLSVDGGSEVSLSNDASASVGCLALGIRTKENATKSFDVDFVGFYAPTAR